MANEPATEMPPPTNGEFCWTEIITAEVDVSKDFYGKVFGWEFHQSKATGKDFEYLEYKVPNSYPMGGLFKMTAEMSGDGEIPPPHFMNYIAVDDADRFADRAVALGGKIVVPPTDIPNVGRFSVIQDPTGGTFSIIALKVVDHS